MSEHALTAYCVKCKTTRPIEDAAPVYMANGRPATRGICPECGTGLFKIGPTPAHATLPQPVPSSPPREAKAKVKAAPKAAVQGQAAEGEAPSAPLTQPVEAHCFKCKVKRPMQDGRAIFMANGRPAAEGICPECGTRLFKIGATPDHAGLPRPAAQARVGRKTRDKAQAGAKTRGDDKAKRKEKVKGQGRAKGDGQAQGRAAGRGGSAAPRGRAASRLVIVESPAKARSVGRFLGGGYEVRASVGHVRDLLRSKLSVDLENDFEPTYRVPNEKRDVVKELKSAAARAKEIYLATDPDREGEAIAWHLVEAAEIPPERTHRVVFHEITQHAVADAFTHSREIDMQLVDAQQARRILDRLVGYQISPLLWDRVKSGLSAGRVQSVALRLIVEREREILAFVPVEYWSIDAELARQTSRGEVPRPGFRARLIRIRGADADLKDRADADRVVADLEDAVYVVSSVKRGERKRRPYAPFTTSTLQQDAAQRLGMSASRTMRVAQDLYEGIDLGPASGNGEGPVGLITYMRTDSVNIAQEAAAEARGLIAETYGPEYLPDTPNVYRSRAKNAQEAHEAIRPTSSLRIPSMLRDRLKRDHYRLYELIWQRFIASQMAAAVYDTVSVEVEAGPPPRASGGPPAAAERPYLFRASGSVVKFPGFLVVYSGGAAGPTNGNGAAGEGVGGSGGGAAQDAADDGVLGQGAEPTGQEILRELAQGEPLDLLRLIPEQHFTQPPPRYSEASLVKTLEENGIGRPSTYAAIISTILDRGYVERAEKRLAPTELGFTVNDLLVKHFDPLFNVGFTAGMEEHLDSIASGEEEMVPVLRDFYNFFGPQLREAERTMAHVVVEPEKTGEVCPECGGDLVIKQGRYGKFVGCANYPDCRFTKPLIVRIGVACPRDGGDLAERRTRRGRIFYGCANYPQCDFTSWKRPLPQSCPRCGGLLVLVNKAQAECIVCHERTRIDSENA